MLWVSILWRQACMYTLISQFVNQWSSLESYSCCINNISQLFVQFFNFEKNIFLLGSCILSLGNRRPAPGPLPWCHGGLHGALAVRHFGGGVSEHFARLVCLDFLVVLEAAASFLSRTPVWTHVIVKNNMYTVRIHSLRLCDTHSVHVSEKTQIAKTTIIMSFNSPAQSVKGL